MNPVIVEFSHDGKPFTVITESEYGKGYDIYDFDWSKQSNCLLYHQSGGGSWPYEITHKEYWVKTDTLPSLVINKIGSKQRVDFDPTNLFNDNWYTESQWCRICEDFSSTEDTCKHLWWDENICLYLEVKTCCDKFEEEYTYYFGMYNFEPEERFFTKDEVRIDKCPYCGKLPTITEEA